MTSIFISILKKIFEQTDWKVLFNSVFIPDAPSDSSGNQCYIEIQVESYSENSHSFVKWESPYIITVPFSIRNS